MLIKSHDIHKEKKVINNEENLTEPLTYIKTETFVNLMNQAICLS